MLGPRQTERILRDIEASHAKAISGWDDQLLQAIEAGGAFRATIVTVGFVSWLGILFGKLSTPFRLSS